MVSAAKLKRAQDRVVNARPFANKMMEVLVSWPAEPTRASIIHYSTLEATTGTWWC